MAQLRAPGVYFEPNEQRVAQLELGQTGVPVFLGIARRGPLDRAVRVTSESRFVEIFGEPVAQTYLGPALRGFFDNGGDTCFVLRVARTTGEEGEDVARRACYAALDRAGQATLSIEAQDEGTWGNELRLSLSASAIETRTLLTRDADTGDTSIQVKSTHGITPGTLLRIHAHGGAEQWVSVIRVDNKVLGLAEGLEHPFASAAPTFVVPHGFQLRVRDLDREERFDRLSMLGNSARFIERVINEQSRLVRVKALRPTTPLAQVLPIDCVDVRLQGGGDGIADLGPEDFIGHDRGPADRRGLWSLVEHDESDLLVLPDLMAAYQNSKRFKSLRDVEVVQDAAIDFCERSRSCFAILDLPPGGDFEEALRWRQLFDTAHAGFYHPWVSVLDGPRCRLVPPSGHVAGIFSRSDRMYGVHKAPANEVVESIVDLEVLLQDVHLAMLNDAGINCLRPFGPRGLRVWGARTASSAAEWRFLNVRRTISTIGASIERGMQWAVFEPNGPALWKRVTRMVASFLTGLRERGMLTGETPEQAFYVRCDHETNAPDDVDRGMLVTEIGLAVTRPVEFIVFRLSQRLENQAQQNEE